MDFRGVTGFPGPFFTDQWWFTGALESGVLREDFDPSEIFVRFMGNSD